MRISRAVHGYALCKRPSRLLVIAVMILSGRIAWAQVANDDCAGAIALGVPFLPNSWHCDPLQGGSGYSPLITDSTDQALVDFPYPANPNACFGYSNMIAAPGRDVWYAVRVTCDLLFEITCSDTCHVSAWIGGDCATLYPGGCFTVLPNSPTPGFAQGFNPPQDTILLQICAKDPTVDLGFTLCLKNPDPPCTPTPFTWDTPTPVVCFEGAVDITPCTAVGSSDGAIQITVLNGNGPWSILWMDGDTGFVRNDLSEGTYSYTITDGMGCLTTDTVQVGVNGPLGVSAHADPSGFWVQQFPGSVVVGTTDPLFHGQASLTDMLGRTLMVRELVNGQAFFDQTDFHCGGYFIRFTSGNSIVAVRRFILTQ